MTARNQWKHLEFTLALSKRLFSLLNLKTFAQALLSTYWRQNSKTQANRYFREHNMLPRNNADVTHCGKTLFYFQNKASTELKTGQQIYSMFKNDFYLIKVKTLKIFNFSFFLTSRENQELIKHAIENPNHLFSFTFSILHTFESESLLFRDR